MLILDRRESELTKDGRPIRPGGHELTLALRRYDIELATNIELPFGDAMFAGHGEQGDCTVGIEHKRLSDVVASMKDRRLSGHQLRGLWASYDYVWLVVEGVWRPGSGGEIEELHGHEWRPLFGRDRQAVNYRQVVSFLHSLTLRSRSPQTGEPLRVIRTQNPKQSAAEYVALYKGFTEKTWEQHHAHDQIYTEMTLPPRRVGFVQAKVTKLWKMLAQMDGLDRRAQAVAAYFEADTLAESLQNVVGADEKAWRKVPGVGKKGAAEIWRQFHDEDDGK